MAEDAQLKLRVPQDLKEYLEIEAKNNHRTINGEVVYRLETSRLQTEQAKADVKVINLNNGYRRLIFGKFMNSFDLDFTQDLTSLRRDVELSLNALKDSSLSKKLAFFNKRVRVYEGGHHIDIIDDGVGSLNWLIVEDHWVGQD